MLINSICELVDTHVCLFARTHQDLTRPHPYMASEKQPELNSSMRAILVDWLVEVHMKFRLLPETLYLCVNILDRYLSREGVNRNRLQLVGVTALLIACKYEEIYPPEVRDCVYITDRAYTRQEVLDMEAAIVKTLRFTLTVPTGYPFLQRFLHVTKATTTVRNLASYYMERMLQEHSALMFKPSLLAAAAICLATNHPDRRDFDEDFDDDETRTSVYVSGMI
jgi:G2/mitotic-specific cyclin-B, other